PRLVVGGGKTNPPQERCSSPGWGVPDHGGITGDKSLLGTAAEKRAHSLLRIELGKRIPGDCTTPGLSCDCPVLARRTSSHSIALRKATMSNEMPIPLGVG